MVRFVTAIVVIGVATWAASAGMAAVVTFDSELPGKVYGAPAGDPPGVVVLVEDGIEMSMNTFFWSGGGAAYELGEIVTPPNSFAVNATQALNTNNISAVFDFVAIGPAEYVSIEFVDLGGNVNLDINGMGMQNVAGVTALAPMPPFNVNVVALPSGGGFRGLIEVGQFGADDIDKLLIGGQELGIDTVRKSFFGDVNTDGTVNGLDVDPFVELLTSGEYMIAADMDRDGQVNGLDVDLFVEAVLGGGAQPVPEPSTLLLCLIALSVVGGWRRRVD